MSLESESISKQERLDVYEEGYYQLIDLKSFIIKEIEKYTSLEKEAREGTQISYYAGILNGLHSVLKKL